MRTFNVLVSVVDLVEAESAEAAVRSLTTRLRRAGFEVHETDAFESEALDEPKGD